jgi:hypothetical protein
MLDPRAEPCRSGFTKVEREEGAPDFVRRRIA